jgi:uncharacterized Ntn-hydrolase superfamily protein
MVGRQTEAGAEGEAGGEMSHGQPRTDTDRLPLRRPSVSVRVCLWLIILSLVSSLARAISGEAPFVATFSIVAADPRTGEIGVAVQSRFLAVGAVVPWAKAGVGAVATQSRANTTFGPEGLKLLAAGTAPDDVIKQLITPDEDRGIRQVGIVSADGRAATFTGAECHAWAGGCIGKNYAAQGNILAGEAVVTAMAESFEKSADRGKELAQRLIDALAAGQAAGGDRRGMQSAALLVVREGWGYAGLNDRYRDLRVDDHTEPIVELQRIYELHRRLFPPTTQEAPGTKSQGPEKPQGPISK